MRERKALFQNKKPCLSLRCCCLQVEYVENWAAAYDLDIRDHTEVSPAPRSAPPACCGCYE